MRQLLLTNPFRNPIVSAQLLVSSEDDLEQRGYAKFCPSSPGMDHNSQMPNGSPKLL